MNVERLKAVAEVLRGVPPEQFNMGTFWDDEADAKGGCGTVGCAVGHYCHANPKADLYLDEWGWPALRSNPRPSGFPACADHFGITSRMARELFDPGCYDDGEDVSKADVLSRLEAFIASGGRIEAGV